MGAYMYELLMSLAAHNKLLIFTNAVNAAISDKNFPW